MRRHAVRVGPTFRSGVKADKCYAGVARCVKCGTKRTSGLCVLGVLCVDGTPESAGGAIYGFTTRSAARQRSVERRFLALPSSEKARAAQMRIRYTDTAAREIDEARHVRAC